MYDEKKARDWEGGVADEQGGRRFHQNLKIKNHHDRSPPRGEPAALYSRHWAHADSTMLVTSIMSFW